MAVPQIKYGVNNPRSVGYSIARASDYQPNGMLDVTDFGADPTGATPSDTAFEAVRDQVYASRINEYNDPGGAQPKRLQYAIYVPPGNYLLQNPEVLWQVTDSDPCRGYELVGAGRGMSHLIFNPSSAAAMFDSSTAPLDATFTDLSITSLNSDAVFWRSSGSGVVNHKLERMWFAGTWDRLFSIKGTGSGQHSWNSIDMSAATVLCCFESLDATNVIYHWRDIQCPNGGAFIRAAAGGHHNLYNVSASNYAISPPTMINNLVVGPYDPFEWTVQGVGPFLDARGIEYETGEVVQLYHPSGATLPDPTTVSPANFAEWYGSPNSLIELLGGTPSNGIQQLNADGLRVELSNQITGLVGSEWQRGVIDLNGVDASPGSATGDRFVIKANAGSTRGPMFKISGSQIPGSAEMIRTNDNLIDDLRAKLVDSTLLDVTQESSSFWKSYSKNRQATTHPNGYVVQDCVSDQGGDSSSRFLIWGGAYELGTTYSKNSLVEQAGWGMVANKETNDQPAPVPLGDAYYPYTGAFPERNQTAKSITFGTRYTFQQGLYVVGYRAHVPVGGIADDWRVFFVEDPDGAARSEQVMDFSAPSEGTLEFAVPATIFLAGETVEILATVTDVDPTPTTWTAFYDYRRPNNPTNPVVGEAVHPSSAPGVIAFNYLDDDSTDRTAALQALTVGDRFETQGVLWTILSIDTGTAGQISFGVTPAIRASSQGRSEFTFHTITATSMPMVDDVDHWLGNSNIRGVFGYTDDTGLTQRTTDDNAYGIELKLQDATVSPDWDFLSYSTFR